MNKRILAFAPLLWAGLSACSGDNGATGGAGGAPSSSSSGHSSLSSSSGASSSSSESLSSSSAALSSSSSNSSSSGAVSSSASSNSSGASSSSSSSNSSGASSSSSSSSNGAIVTRPQLGATDAASYTLATYFAQAGVLGALVTDNWDPSAGVDLSVATPTFTVAADGSGTHTTVQAAITAAVALGGTTRIFILVKAGTYNESVCVPTGGPLITLYGTDSDASKVVIVAGHSNPEPKAAGVSANPCNANLTGVTYGTSGSATFAAYANGFQAKNLTFANSYDETLAGANQQAVAVMTQGDRLVFDNVRALGNQDTFYAKTPNVTTVSRVYVKNSYIEGDVDFIFGRASLVVDGSTIKYLTARQGTKGGTVVAPSTAPGNPHGFLIVNSTFTADATTPAGLIYLGRAWDEGVTTGTYVAGTSPNGQALIRDSILGGHVRSAGPWATSTSGRVFDAAGNRLTEFANTGAGAAP